MKRKRYSVEQIIGKLREAEVLLSQGRTVKQVSRALGVTEQTYYRWRKKYGGAEDLPGKASERAGTGKFPIEEGGSGIDL